MCECCEWNRRTIGSANIDTLQRLGTAEKFGSDFHNHEVLIELAVHDGDLPLTEGVVERIIDIGGGDT